jgi:hypothetical protein
MSILEKNFFKKTGLSHTANAELYVLKENTDKRV